MVNEIILGGLKSALARGESLKKAMMTMYNAGYKREEISEAARIVNKPRVAAQTQPASQSKQKPSLISKSKAPKKLAPQKTQQPVPSQEQTQVTKKLPKGKKTLQRVSNYGQPLKPGGKTMIIVLGFLLLLLIGILAAIFLFKDDLLSFFNNLFS